MMMAVVVAAAVAVAAAMTATTIEGTATIPIITMKTILDMAVATIKIWSFE
jgi:hypothetical protein